MSIFYNGPEVQNTISFWTKIAVKMQVQNFLLILDKISLVASIKKVAHHLLKTTDIIGCNIPLLCISSVIS